MMLVNFDVLFILYVWRAAANETVKTVVDAGVY